MLLLRKRFCLSVGGFLKIFLSGARGYFCSEEVEKGSQAHYKAAKTATGILGVGGSIKVEIQWSWAMQISEIIKGQRVEAAIGSIKSKLWGTHAGFMASIYSFLERAIDVLN